MYMVRMYKAARKAPTIRAAKPRTMSIDPKKANRIMVIRYGMKYLSELMKHLIDVFSCERGL